MSTENFIITKRDGSEEPFCIDKIKKRYPKSVCRIERSAQCRIARTHHVAPALLQWDECREHSKPGGGCLDERRPLQCGQDLYCLSQPPHHGSRNSTKTSFPHRLLQCRQRGYRIKVRCERQCREQEPRHLIGEIPKGDFIRLNRRLLCDKLKQMYGKEAADR